MGKFAANGWIEVFLKKINKKGSTQTEKKQTKNMSSMINMV